MSSLPTPTGPDRPAAQALDALARHLEDDADLLAALPADVVAMETDPSRVAALLTRIEGNDVRVAGPAPDRRASRQSGLPRTRRWTLATSALVVATSLVIFLSRETTPRPLAGAALGAEVATLELLAGQRPPAKGMADLAAGALGDGARALLAAWSVPDPPDSARAAQAAASFGRAYGLLGNSPSGDDSLARPDVVAFFAGKAFLAARRPAEARRWLARVGGPGPREREATRLIQELSAPVAP